MLNCIDPMTKDPKSRTSVTEIKSVQMQAPNISKMQYFFPKL